MGHRMNTRTELACLLECPRGLSGETWFVKVLCLETVGPLADHKGYYGNNKLDAQVVALLGPCQVEWSR